MSTFSGLWEGGYFEGDPLDPKASSSYGGLSYMSILHATYLVCIKPYLSHWDNALEIGSGRGAWTKCLLPFKTVHVLEVLPPEETHLYEYIGKQRHVFYHTVKDFSCIELPDNYFRFMFSFGCMCHIPFSGITAYARNLYPKLTDGSHCFWMIADYAWAGLVPDEDNEPRPGRWYDAGLDRTCEMLEKQGYIIHDSNVRTNMRDPIIHFGKI